MQRDAAGKIKLGLDLQGGTSFLVEMDTNALANAQEDTGTNHVARAPDVSGALSQAVEVLRKRVDAFGVAEPVIQPAGGNRILIQLPGLSQVGEGKREDANPEGGVSGVPDRAGRQLRNHPQRPADPARLRTAQAHRTAAERRAGDHGGHRR